jgi:hypothetical protein
MFGVPDNCKYADLEAQNGAVEGHNAHNGGV